MKRFALALGTLLLAATVAACEDDGLAPSRCTESNTPPDTTKKWHGQPCQNNSECAYGLCYKNAQILGISGQGICTKNCCGGTYSSCLIDEENVEAEHPHIGFTCIHPSESDGRTPLETLIPGYCAPNIKGRSASEVDEGNADCAAYNPALVKWASLCTGGTEACIALGGADWDPENEESLCRNEPDPTTY